MLTAFSVAYEPPATSVRFSPVGDGNLQTTGALGYGQVRARQKPV